MTPPQIEVIYKITGIDGVQADRADEVGALITAQATKTWQTHREYVEHGGPMPVDRETIADDAWRASLEQELKTAIAERDAARRDYVTMRDVQREASRERDRARDERDAWRNRARWFAAAYDHTRDEVGREWAKEYAAAREAEARAVAPLDPSSPADLRRAADLLEAMDVDWRPPGGDGWTPSNLRARATRVAADAAEDALVEKVARVLAPLHCAWEDWIPEARAAIAVIREAGQ